jgi:DNA-binding NtrC family response regulator
VTICHDGQSALHQFVDAPGRFDLVLTDQTMPKMTGKELINALLDIRPDLPVILSTGYSQPQFEDNSDNSDKLSHCKYIEKPINLNTLIHVIEEILSSEV